MGTESKTTAANSRARSRRVFILLRSRGSPLSAGSAPSSGVSGSSFSEVAQAARGRAKARARRGVHMLEPFQLEPIQLGARSVTALLSAGA